MNPQTQFYLCIFMLLSNVANSVETNGLHLKNYHTLSCFLKCMPYITLMLKTYCKIIYEIIIQNN